MMCHHDHMCMSSCLYLKKPLACYEESKNEEVCPLLAFSECRDVTSIEAEEAFASPRLLAKVKDKIV